MVYSISSNTDHPDMAAGSDKHESQIESMLSVERVETGSTKVDSKDEGAILETRVSEDLPFSKARCIALVTTLASVPFLSVSMRRYTSGIYLATNYT